MSLFLIIHLHINKISSIIQNRLSFSSRTKETFDKIIFFEYISKIVVLKHHYHVFNIILWEVQEKNLV